MHREKEKVPEQLWKRTKSDGLRHRTSTPTTNLQGLEQVRAGRMDTPSGGSPETALINVRGGSREKGSSL